MKERKRPNIKHKGVSACEMGIFLEGKICFKFSGHFCGGIFRNFFQREGDFLLAVFFGGLNSSREMYFGGKCVKFSIFLFPANGVDFFHSFQREVFSFLIIVFFGGVRPFEGTFLGEIYIGFLFF